MDPIPPINPMLQILSSWFQHREPQLDPISWMIVHWNDPVPPNVSGTDILGPLGPTLIHFMQNTPENLTTSNPIVQTAFTSMLAVSNGFFLLLIILGAMQIMMAQTTGTLSVPLSQFVPKILLTALLMNLSFFFCKNLLDFNNALCELVSGNLVTFFNAVNRGSRITVGEAILLYVGVVVFMNVLLVILLLQVFERVALWNLLLVFAPIAFLCSFLPHTSTFFSFWGRMFVVVTFTQFVQFLALALGLEMVATAGLHGIDGLFLAAAMLLLLTKIPGLLARFSSLSLQGAGIGTVVSTVVLAARFLAA